MSNALIFTFTKKENVIATLYYHWGADHAPSLLKSIEDNLLKDIENLSNDEFICKLVDYAEHTYLGRYLKNEDIEEYKTIANQISNRYEEGVSKYLKILLGSHGGINTQDSEAFKRFNKKFKVDEFLTRDEGIVSISKREIERIKGFGENITIDLTSHNKMERRE